jgi:hypothetical protein
MQIHPKIEKPAWWRASEGQLDNWLKALVAGACVVIIVGGGWFGWSRYRDYKAARDYATAAPIRHCDLVYSDVKRFNALQPLLYIDGHKIAAEQAACDKLLGIAR